MKEQTDFFNGSSGSDFLIDPIRGSQLSAKVRVFKRIKLKLKLSLKTLRKKPLMSLSVCVHKIRHLVKYRFHQNIKSRNKEEIQKQIVKSGTKFYIFLLRV